MKNKKMGILWASLLMIVLLATACSTDHKDKKEDSPEATTQPAAMVEIRDKTEAPDIDWLAAEAVLGVTMIYDDYEFEHIYLDEKNGSVYTVIKTEGKEDIIESKPLDGPRDKAGTRDLSAQDQGYATFDSIGKLPKDASHYEEKTIEDLKPLINESVLVTVIEN